MRCTHEISVQLSAPCPSCKTEDPVLILFVGVVELPASRLPSMEVLKWYCTHCGPADGFFCPHCPEPSDE